MEGYPILAGTLVFPHGAYEVWAKTVEDAEVFKWDVASFRITGEKWLAFSQSYRLRPITADRADDPVVVTGADPDRL